MLSAHSNIHFQVETHFFKRFILPFLVHKKLPLKDELLEDKFLKRLDSSIRSKIIDKRYSGLYDLKSAFLEIIRAECSIWGDKDTEYVRYIEHLWHIFPEATLIHVIRDPRDVVNSRVKTEWGKNRGIAFHSAEYSYYIREVLRKGSKLFAGKYFEVRYEDLIIDPRNTLKTLCQHLGIPYESSMLRYQQESKRLVTSDERDWKQNLNKAIIRDNLRKWKSDLDSREVAMVEYGLYNFMREHGYEPSGHMPSFVDKLKHKLIRILFRFKTNQEKLT